MDKPVATENYKPRKWYNSYRFPLIPIIKVREANEYNTRSISFHWLFFQFWTLDSFNFEVSFVVSEHWGIGVIGIFPYLRWVVAIPLPEKFGMWVQKNLWRRSKNH